MRFLESKLRINKRAVIFISVSGTMKKCFMPSEKLLGLGSVPQFCLGVLGRDRNQAAVQHSDS